MSTPNSENLDSSPNGKAAIAVYCGSSTGKKEEYVKAAICASLCQHIGFFTSIHCSCFYFPALGHALARERRPLVYGGGSQGIMGIVSRTVLADGGAVTGVIPYAMHIRGGEREKQPGIFSSVEILPEPGREKVLFYTM